MKTVKNRLASLALIGLGVFAALVDGDATFLIFALLLGVPLFFEKENQIR